MDIMVKKVTDTVSGSDEKEVLKKKKLNPKNFNSGKLSKIIVAIVLIVAVSAAGYFYKQYQDVKKDPKTAQVEKNKAETQRVLDKLKAAILVTESDAPTVARVEDPEKLKSSNPDFYKDILKGDYLIIFPKRAVVYRETNNQIINIAPIINTADLQKKQEETKNTTQPAATTPKR